MGHFIRALCFSLCLAGALSACGGPSTAVRADISRMLSAGQHREAAKYIEAHKSSSYGKSNAVLFHLDKGAALHYGGRYRQSDHELDLAESRIEELYTTSVSKAAGRFLINDNTEDYRGRPQDRAMLNVMRALNYLFLGKPEESVVEARKVSEFLVRFAAAAEAKFSYKDDAFAHYLSGLVFAAKAYRDAARAGIEPNLEDARISFANARAAYANYAGAYATPTPQIDLPPLRRGEGELVFIHYNGPPPRIVSRDVQVAWDHAMVAVRETNSDSDGTVGRAVSAGLTPNSITYAIPMFQQDGFRVVRSVVRVEAVGAQVETELVEDVSSILAKQIQEEAGATQARAIARATIKYLTAKVAEETTRSAMKGSQYGALAAFGVGLFARAVAAASESADDRSWASLPAQVRLARTRLPPGKYDVTIDLVRADGVPVGTRVIHNATIADRRMTFCSLHTAL